MNLLIVGNRGGTNIGGCFERAADTLRLSAHLVETWPAMAAPTMLRRMNWWLRGHRPTWLDTYSANVVDLARQWRPALVLAVGIAPLNAKALRALGTLGAVCVNYLTDDPWNPSHHAPWFFDALPHYHLILTPRRANLDDLRRSGSPNVSYLPFAYDPALHYPPVAADLLSADTSDTDVLFVGAGDADRVPLITALARSGYRLSLYGSFWERYAATRSLSQGQIDVATLRKVTGGARVALCLVRRANRDGHVMRSYEIPAMGACMLTEDTLEHRELFGIEGEATLYFHTTETLLEKLRWLLANPAERTRLASAAHSRIVAGANTYADRLRAVLELTGLAGHGPRRFEPTL